MNVEVVVAVISAAVALVSTGGSLYGQSPTSRPGRDALPATPSAWPLFLSPLSDGSLRPPRARGLDDAKLDPSVQSTAARSDIRTDRPVWPGRPDDKIHIARRARGKPIHKCHEAGMKHSGNRFRSL